MPTYFYAYQRRLHLFGALYVAMPVRQQNRGWHSSHPKSGQALGTLNKCCCIAALRHSNCGPSPVLKTRSIRGTYEFTTISSQALSALSEQDTKREALPLKAFKDHA